MEAIVRKKSRGVAKALAAVSVAVMLLASCAAGGGAAEQPPEGESAKPVSGGDLVVGDIVRIPAFDPAFCYQVMFSYCSALYGSLAVVDNETGELRPAMAESVESEDGQVWTVKLREGVTFSDGTPYDAAAVIYNWERFADPANLSGAAGVLAGASWEATDELTATLTLASPDFSVAPRFQYELGAIGSPTALESLGDAFAASPVGAGPFLLKEANDVEVVYTRNPDYWDEDRPYLDSLTIKVYLDVAQRADAVRAGLDGSMMLDPVPAQELEDEGFVVTRFPQIGGIGVALNLDNADVGDDDLRMALLLSLDAAQINVAVPHLDPATAFLAPDSPLRDDALGVYPEMDLEAAQEHLDAFLERTGREEFELTLLTQAGVTVLAQPAELLQAQWGQLAGLTVKVEAGDSAYLRGLMRSGEYQAVVWSAGGGPNLYRIYDLFHTNGVENFAGYSNPAVDAALDLTRSSNDPDELEEAYAIVNGEVSSDPYLRLWRNHAAQFVSTEQVRGATELTGYAVPLWAEVWVAP